MVVRSLIHRMGYRFSLHNANLPGKPDVVLSRLHKVVFVHGCFWHMHRCKYGTVTPRTNRSFWQNKRCGNVVRDRASMKDLRREGWRVLVVWECWTRKEGLDRRLLAFLKR
jgi:DNA mismatch endonuclease (patch repair protein)